MLRPALVATLVSVLTAGAAQAQTVRELFRMAPCSEGASLQPEGRRTVVVDERNGYLRAGDPREELGDEYIFAVFRRADGSRLFACYREERSDDGTGSELTFYELREGRMVEFEEPLVPVLDLEDFLAPGAPLPPRRLRVVQLHYGLPRVGTTIRVDVESLDEMPLSGTGIEPGHSFSVAEIQRYQRTVDTSYYRAIELNWDPTRGVFVMGRKIRRG